MAKKPTKAQAKIGKVMHEWKAGKLHAGKDPDGKGPKKAPVVKSQKQAIAVALRQAGVAKKKPKVAMAKGGMTDKKGMC